MGPWGGGGGKERKQDVAVHSEFSMYCSPGPVEGNLHINRSDPVVMVMVIVPFCETRALKCHLKPARVVKVRGNLCLKG